MHSTLAIREPVDTSGTRRAPDYVTIEIELGNRGLILDAEVTAEVYGAEEWAISDIGDISVRVTRASSWVGDADDHNTPELLEALAGEVHDEISRNWCHYQVRILEAYARV